MAGSPRIIVAFDTSFIQRQNFLEGGKMRELAKLAAENTIELCMSDVVFRETLARFKKELLAASDGVKKPKELLGRHTRIFKNCAGLENYFDLPEVNVEKYVSTFTKDFNEYIKNGKVRILPSEKVNIAGILNDYFDVLPPFKDSERKKYEFPDAINLKCLELHYPHESVNLLTHDSDLHGYTSPIIKAITDETTFIDRLIRRSVEKIIEEKNIKIIDQYFNTRQQEVANEIEEFGKITLPMEIAAVDSYGGVKIGDVNTLKVKVLTTGKPKFINVNEEHALVEVPVELMFDATFTGYDFMITLTNGIFGELDITKNYRLNDTVNCIVTWAFDFTDDKENPQEFIFSLDLPAGALFKTFHRIDKDPA